MIEKQAINAVHGKLDMQMTIADFYLLQNSYFSGAERHVTQ